LKRLLALLILAALVWVGYQYYWKTGTSPVSQGQVDSARDSARQTMDAVGDKLRSTKTTGSVKAAFELNRSLSPYPIDISADGDAVVLRGDVPNEETRALAGKVAASVPDVAQVRNELRVSGVPAAAPAGGDRSIGENVDDRAIETKVRLAFSLNRELKGTNISVTSYRKAVTLAGDVGSEGQHQTALLVARDAPGVASVTDQIRVSGGAGTVPAPGPAISPVNPPAPVAATGQAQAAQAAERALAQSATLSAYGLKVSENNGRLVLTGSVRTAAEKELAGLTARDAARTTVDNAIEIRP
jgi:hyperosmotically inducible periplasmic protein